ncbi:MULTISPECIES: hypothetical protein [unclassified Aureispira]|uniref:hypothetical protein n=1 Tax=unclassified Aureispira TaxID=2649989 RepID=UPI00069741E9|nr:MULTISPECIES: hypothetical protein [unclassified Aureispira]WMX12864.1 hypothetical protein QP953_18675 [Aureispira sp. CCB-E]
MKNIILILLFTFSSSFISAQHNISATAGWTVSTLYKVGTRAALNTSSYYADLYEFTPFYTLNINVKYEYTYNLFRLSTGFSLLSLGANDYFFKGFENVFMYLTIPVLLGYKKNFSKEISLVIEGGSEFGLSLANVGSVINAAKKGQTRPYIGLLFGIEGKYKRFSLGARFHLGLNDFEQHTFSSKNETIYFKHIGSTIYLGYTIWDSSKVKKKKQKE